MSYATCTKALAGVLAVGLLALVVTAAGSARAQAPAEGSVALRRVWPEAELQRPVGLVPVPGSAGDMVVLEQYGVVQRLAAGARGAAGVFLDLRGRVSRAGNEEGLLGLAFHPDWPATPAVYVYYSAADPRRSVLARFTAPAGTGTPAGGPADAGSEAVLLEVAQPYSNHNGGQLAFGPDGMLYVALGDGGSGGDPQEHGQNPRTLLGSLLRIDVDRTTGDLAYAIPPDNPFAGATDGRRGEIWAYGLRNPWRFSFDRATGTLWAADVGQNAEEEVNRIARGGNYGWNTVEGRRCYDPPRGCDRTGLTPPVTAYGHDQGRSVTGGFVYRGRAIPALAGRYLFADYVSGRIWSIPADARGFTPPAPLLATELYIPSFGQDAAGELYLLDHREGRVFRLVPAP